jgi:hypothetical protein
MSESDLTRWVLALVLGAFLIAQVIDTLMIIWIGRRLADAEQRIADIQEAQSRRG